VVGALDSRHALTLFPYLDAAPSHFDDPIDDGDREAIIDMLATLHTARPSNRPSPAWTSPGLVARTPSQAVSFWPCTKGRCVTRSRDWTAC
jgi:hypothetical protein